MREKIIQQSKIPADIPRDEYAMEEEKVNSDDSHKIENEKEAAYETIEGYEADIIKAKTKEVIKIVQEDGIDACFFLDKSARPLSWVFSRVANAVLDRENIPAIKYINIGLEKNDYYKSTDKIVAEIEESPDYFALKEQWKNLKGGKILVIDDMRATGDTLAISEKVLKKMLDTSDVRAFFFDEYGEHEDGFHTGFSWRPGTGDSDMDFYDPIERVESLQGKTGVFDIYDDTKLLTQANTENSLNNQVSKFNNYLKRWLDDKLTVDEQRITTKAIHNMESNINFGEIQVFFEKIYRRKNEKYENILAKTYGVTEFSLKHFPQRMRETLERSIVKIKNGDIKSKADIRELKNNIDQAVREFKLIKLISKEIRMPASYDLLDILEKFYPGNNLLLHLQKKLNKFFEEIEDMRANKDYAKRLRHDLNLLADKIILEINAK